MPPYLASNSLHSCNDKRVKFRLRGRDLWCHDVHNTINKSMHTICKATFERPSIHFPFFSNAQTKSLFSPTKKTPNWWSCEDWPRSLLAKDLSQSVCYEEQCTQMYTPPSPPIPTETHTSLQPEHVSEDRAFISALTWQISWQITSL